MVGTQPAGHSINVDAVANEDAFLTHVDGYCLIYFGIQDAVGWYFRGMG
jgi:hypothetical protein